MTDLKARAERIKELRKKATPGEWYVHEGLGSIYSRVTEPGQRAHDVLITDLAIRSHNVLRNAAFIAAAHEMCDLIESQQAALAELEKDAARYRWLRENWYLDISVGTQAVADMTADVTRSVDGDEMDAAVDRALAPSSADGEK